MAYTPPAINAVNFDVEAYNPPAINAVNFEMLDYYSITPADGSVSITGDTGAFTVTYEFTPAAGSVVVTGEQAAVGVTYAITPANGSVAITGEQAAIEVIYVVTPADGSISITGDEVTISFTAAEEDLVIGGGIGIIRQPARLPFDSTREDEEFILMASVLYL